jgi:hypothetical protein
VRATATLAASFQEAANFIALSVTPVKANQRIIATIETGNKNGGRNTAGRFQGRGRAGRQGRGGRGRGRSRGRGARYQPNTGYYTANEWHSLTQDQKSNVLEARGTKRTVSTIEMATQEDASAITGPITTNNLQGGTVNPSLGGNAGNQFGRSPRHIGMLSSGPRMMNRTLRVASITQEPECNKTGYKAIENVPIVLAGTAFNDPTTGETFILIINQALYLGDVLEETLLNPNQMRHNGLIVDDVPKHLAPDPQHATHSIYIPNHDVRIPLVMRGIVSGFCTRYPTIHELETCLWIDLTNDADWEPNSGHFAEQERTCEDRLDTGIGMEEAVERRIYAIKAKPWETPTNALSSNLSSHYSTVGREMTEAMIKSIKVHSTHTQNQRPAEALRNRVSQTFGIGLETADRTIQATTQLAIRHAIHPIHRRYQMQVAQLRYPRLTGRHGKFHMDTFFSSTASLSNCAMGQMYTNDVDFTKFYPMKKKK